MHWTTSFDLIFKCLVWTVSFDFPKDFAMCTYTFSNKSMSQYVLKCRYIMFILTIKRGKKSGYRV